MAGSVMTGGGVGSMHPTQRSYPVALALLVALYFMIGFITVLNDILIPSMKDLFDLKASQAMLIQFAFFIAYGIWSIPAGILIEKIGYKKGLVVALGVIATGLFLFVPAASIMKYGFFLFVLFVVASGLTFMQVALNPLIVAVGPEKTGSSRMNLGGTMNSFATTIGPIIGGAFILQSVHEGDFTSHELFLAAKSHAVQGPYVVLALVIIAIATALYFIKLPEIGLDKSKETTAHDQSETKESIFDYHHLL